MSEKINDLYIEINMETGKLLEGANSASHALSNFEKSLEKASKTVEQFEAKLSKSAKVVKENSTSAGRAGKAVGDLANTMLRGGQSVESYITSISSLGYLFGGLAGIIATAAGVLLADFIGSLSSSESQIQVLKQAMSGLNQVIKLSDSGVAGLSNEYALLLKNNKEMAQHLKNSAINKFEFDIRNAKNAIADLVNEQSSIWKDMGGNGVRSVKEMGVALSNLGTNVDTYSEAMRAAGSDSMMFTSYASTIQQTTEMLAKKFGISREEAFTFGKMLAEVGDNPTPEKINELTRYVSGLSSTTDQGEKALKEWLARLIEAGVNITQVTALLEMLKSTMDDVNTAAQNANFDSMNKALEYQKKLLTEGVQAAEEYKISQAELSDKQKEDLITQTKEVQLLKDKKKATDEAAAKAKQAANQDLQDKKRIVEQLDKYAQSLEVAKLKTKA
ncbi:hypothetical protein [Pasteurella testudinis]|uniref:hypothetical protein n=1 Tax=Pasteurella testudinis TaxID=761 RepID=UPI004059D852